jgi:hypothetical protein
MLHGQFYAQQEEEEEEEEEMAEVNYTETGTCDDFMLPL